MAYSDTFKPSGLPHWIYPNDHPTFQDIDTAMEICNDKFKDINAESASVAADVNANKASIQQLTTGLDTANNSIKALQDLQVADRADIDTNEANITKLQGDYNNVNNDLTATNALLNTTVDDLNKLDSTVQTNTSNINSLTSKVVLNENNIRSLNSLLHVVEGTVNVVYSTKIDHKTQTFNSVSNDTISFDTPQEYNDSSDKTVAFWVQGSGRFNTGNTFFKLESESFYFGGTTKNGTLLNNAGANVGSYKLTSTENTITLTILASGDFPSQCTWDVMVMMNYKMKESE